MGSFNNYIERLKFLDELIRKDGAGSPVEICSRLNISQKTCHTYLNTLRLLGCPLYFEKRTRKYRTAVRGRLIIKWIPESELSTDKDH
jgi:DNA-binding IclR family transcriptional regulator